VRAHQACLRVCHEPAGCKRHAWPRFDPSDAVATRSGRHTHFLTELSNTVQMAFAANRATTPTADQVQPPRRNLSSQCVEQPQRAGAIPCASVRPSSPVCAPVVAGCASSGSSTGWASSPTSAASVNATGPRWSGNHAADRILTGGGQARAFGTVLLAVAESDPNRTRARFTVDGYPESLATVGDPARGVWRRLASLDRPGPVSGVRGPARFALLHHPIGAASAG